jgi:phenylalanyl-tRNA synthetase beta chain
MKFSEAWLREWVDPAISTDELLAQLTMAGLEVDGTEPAANPFTGVVVGEVISVEKHPDADKLSVCQVNNGSDTLQVVCGARNVRAGIKVPYAQIGADLAPDFKIKKAKLRGVESFGMLCSADELGLAEQSEGILELPDVFRVGEDIRVALDIEDTVIEVDLTPNRGDCLSIAGIAREVGVLNRAEVNEPTVNAVSETIAYSLPVVLQNPADCPRYLGRVVHNVNTQAGSPLWMQEKLRRSGIRSIDPIVDVTNFVLLELGQPMHAFDFAKLEGGICVRRAEEKEKITLLDEREIELSSDTLVIADHQKALAVAGVMGGLESSVTTETQDIFLESAFFNPVTIAGKARSYGLQTDAAHRYERGVDYDLPRKAMERATALLLEIVGGEAGPIVEAVDSLPELRSVGLREERIQSLLGVTISAEEVEDILTRLGLVIEEKNEGSWVFSVPSYRFDISIVADLIEELARIYGYNNLPVTEPLSRFKLKSHPEAKLGIKAIRRVLSNIGYQEVLTYSFVEPELEASLSRNAEDAIVLANPISQDMSVMRSGLWPGMLKTLKHNQNRQQSRVKIFESGLVFFNENKETKQVPSLAGLIWGSQYPEQWGKSEQALDFYDLKGDVEAILAKTLDKASFSFEAAQHPALQYGQTARIVRNEAPVGWLGSLDPVLQKKLDIPGKVFLFELSLESIETATLPIVAELSKFPGVRRDLALIVSQDLEFEAIKSLINMESGEFLTEMVIFDVYQGENIEKGKKSLALGLTFQHPSRNLIDDEINSIIDNCINALEAQFNAKLR